MRHKVWVYEDGDRPVAGALRLISSWTCGAIPPPARRSIRSSTCISRCHRPHAAYAWADRPSTTQYTPNTFYSYNPSGGAITIRRQSAGLYNITWTGADAAIFDDGNVQVTAYGSGNAQCKVDSSGAENALVRCFDPSGTLVDTFYTVLMGS